MPSSRRTTPNSLAAFRSEQFRLLFAGLLFSNFGIWMQQFAIGWLVVQLAIRDGNPDLAPFYLGLRSIAAAAASLAFGLFAGVYADRVDRRAFLMAARVASAGVAILFAITVISDSATIVIVMILSAASSAAFAFDPPGRHAILPKVVPAQDLFSAMGISRAAMQLAHTIGPLIAGILVIPIGVGGVLLAKAGMDTASVGAMKLMRPQPTPAGARDVGVLRSLKDGLAYVRSNELIRAVLALQLVVAFFMQPFMQLLPAFAVDRLHVGVVELSWLVGSVGTGAFIGAVLTANLGAVERRGLLLLGTAMAGGALLILLALQIEMLGALILLASLGAVQQIFMGTQSIVLQLAAPDRMRGRVMGLQPMIMMSIGPTGVLAFGTLATLVGISTAFLAAGICLFLVCGVAIVRLHVMRELRSTSVEQIGLADAVDVPTAAD